MNFYLEKLSWGQQDYKRQIGPSLGLGLVSVDEGPKARRPGALQNLRTYVKKKIETTKK